MATASSIFAERMRKAFAAVGIGVRSSATQADSAVPQITSGSGVPTASTAKGSIYLRTGGASAAEVAYVATDTVGTWTALANTAVATQVATAGGESYVVNLEASATGEALVKLADNLASAFEVKQSTNSYLKFVTSNDLERVEAKKILALPEVITIDMGDAAHAIVLGTAGAAQTKLLGNVVLCDANSTGTEALTLPTAANCDGLVLIIHNTGGEDITFPDIASLTLSTTEMAIVTCDGTSWRGGVLKLT